MAEVHSFSKKACLEWRREALKSASIFSECVMMIVKEKSFNDGLVQQQGK